MSGGKRPFGYTIVEVMIVLAVSGAMFAIATVMIGDKQAANAYRSGVYEFASRLQSVIDAVNQGQYTDIPVICSTATGLPAFSPGTPGNDTQGTNSDCTFIGKVIHLQAGNDNAYETFIMAGRRTTELGEPVTSLAEAEPMPVQGGSGPNGIDLTTQSVLPQNLQVVKVTIYDSNGAATDSTAFGVVQGMGSSSSQVTGTYASGGQTLSLVYAPNVKQTTSSALSALQSNQAGNSSILAAQGVVMCIADDATNGLRFATVSIGGDGYGQLSVKTKFVGSSCA